MQMLYMCRVCRGSSSLTIHVISIWGSVWCLKVIKQVYLRVLIELLASKGWFFHGYFAPKGTKWGLLCRGLNRRHKGPWSCREVLPRLGSFSSKTGEKRCIHGDETCGRICMHHMTSIGDLFGTFGHHEGLHTQTCCGKDWPIFGRRGSEGFAPLTAKSAWLVPRSLKELKLRENYGKLKVADCRIP